MKQNNNSYIFKSTNSKNENLKKIFPLVTEGNEQIEIHSKLKGKFKDKETLQTSDYIKNLEKTITINKQIINELLIKESSNNKMNQTLENLNKENTELSKQVKDLIKERNNYQSKLLLNDQLLEDFKQKDKESTQEFVDKIQELSDLLNKKEYLIQNLERKFFQAENLLKKYFHSDQEVRMLIKGFNSPLNNEAKRISNVVEENFNLKKEVQDLKKEIEKITKGENIYNIKKNEIPNSGKSEVRSNNQNIQIIQNVEKINNVNVNTELIVKLECSINELNKKIEEISKKNLVLQKRYEKSKLTIDKLYTINDKLCITLRKVNQEIKKISEIKLSNIGYFPINHQDFIENKEENNNVNDISSLIKSTIKAIETIKKNEIEVKNDCSEEMDSNHDNGININENRGSEVIRNISDLNIKVDLDENQENISQKFEEELSSIEENSEKVNI